MSSKITSTTFLGDGLTTRFNTGILEANSTNILAIVNGLVQIPDIDYTVFYYDIVFTVAPEENSDIEVRYYDMVNTGFQGSAGNKGEDGQNGQEGPEGIQGVRGEVGYQGSLGYSGSVGSTGDAGGTGFTGSGGLGYSGSRGIIGITGYVGSYGDLGYVGSIGFTGSSAPGYTGSASPSAPRASQIFQATYASIYIMDDYVNSAKDIFVSVNGLVQLPDVDYNVTSNFISFVNELVYGADIEIRYFAPATGETGFKGSVGQVGYKGSSGYVGSVGYKGSAGAEGPQGPPGGTNGYVGSVGYTGSGGNGFTGSRGIIGETGPVGAPRIKKTFIGNGITSIFDTTETIADATSIFVIVNGLVQIPDTDYSIVDGTKVNLINIPANGSDIEVRIFKVAGFFGSSGYYGSVGYKGSAGDAGKTGYTGSIGFGYAGSIGFGYSGSKGDPGGYTGSAGYRGSQGLQGLPGIAGAPRENQTFISNGIDNTFTLNKPITNTKSIFVMVNGLVLVPDEDYTVTTPEYITITIPPDDPDSPPVTYTIYASRLILNNIPNELSDIEVRYFSDAGETGYRGSVGYQGSVGRTEVYMAGTAPPNPDNGAVWWDTDNGIMNIYYQQNNVWVGIAHGPRGPRGATGAVVYDGGIPSTDFSVGLNINCGRVD